MIHIDEEPPADDSRRFVTVMLGKLTDEQAKAWIEKKGIEEAWIYNNTAMTRVMVWYE